jgi:hypothetical protein
MFPLISINNTQDIYNVLFYVVIRSRACLTAVLSQSLYCQQSQLEYCGINNSEYYKSTCDESEQMTMKSLKLCK